MTVSKGSIINSNVHQFSVCVKEYRRGKITGIYFTKSIKYDERKLDNKRLAIILKSFLTESPVELIL